MNVAVPHKNLPRRLNRRQRRHIEGGPRRRERRLEEPRRDVVGDGRQVAPRLAVRADDRALETGRTVPC